MKRTTGPAAPGARSMNEFGLRFHHLGLAVRRPDEARSILGGLGYRLGAPLFDPEQNVNLFMCRHDAMPDIEVIYPGEGKGPVDRLVARHADGIVYHLCYVTDDLGATLRRFAETGLRAQCVSPPKPAVLFGGSTVSFYMVIGIGLIEIVEGASARPPRSTSNQSHPVTNRSPKGARGTRASSRGPRMRRE
jgi:catechol 2,3-dioxygenase-like lactoylglutathione lyase family enzyme